jgi:tryptophanyl-tRNA synthetase
METRILSGIRPTGHIHLGNYLGALLNGVSVCHTVDEQFFCIVDQHALTTAEDAKHLTEHTRVIAAAYVAAGIDPDSSYIFVQSHVPQHTEFAWYLGCVTPLGWLNRMTQFKDKAGKNKEHALFGLYAYPVLMAADILLYAATHVPVGEDQKQHVELARDIAQAFHNFTEKTVLPIPEPIISKQTHRIMSLRDGTKKMSKSDSSDYSRIHLLDDDDQISLKIRKAKTDMDPIPLKVDDLHNRPEAKNLLTIYAAMSNKTLEDVCMQFHGQLFSTVKSELTDAVIAHLSPVRHTMQRLLQHHDELDRILKLGALRAREVADATMKKIRSALNLYPLL